jgi:hypothetical protein
MSITKSVLHHKNVSLSRIVKINPRDIWRHEALDFTQWLSKDENISLLCEELDINLENIRSEASAGRYNVDIVADDSDTNRKVIIENQLECTDHKHLGQLLTYASAYDASIIIWVVTDYTEEHRQAIDWFNKNISEGINFFLVHLEVYKIDESNPAPKFTIICEPNNWGRTVKSSGEGNMASDTKLLQKEFWDSLKEYNISKRLGVNFNQTPRPQHWYNLSIGSSKCHIGLTINTIKKCFGCEVYVSSDRLVYDKFFGNKDFIESELGYELEWMELPDTVAFRIKVSVDGDVRDRTSWENHFEWFSSRSIEFSRVFKKYL